jgi:hypothetical protein
VAKFGLAARFHLLLAIGLTTERRKAFTTGFTEHTEKYAKEKTAGRIIGGRMMVGGGIGGTLIGADLR